MDNLTHSLAGAVLGQMGLKNKTGLAMPTLIIAANLPDIDAVAVLLGGHQHLALRRGITHGPIAMLILPLLLWGVMLWFDRWQTRRGTRPEKRLPLHKGWLLALAYIGTLSHPALDWLNVYGIRLLEPFSSQWFYGDTLFIIDVWIWAALIIGVVWSLRQEGSGKGNWTRPAWVSFVAVCAYIAGNGAITGVAEAEAAMLLRKHHEPSATMPDPSVVASPVPVQFWRREILWRDDVYYGNGQYHLMKGVVIDPVYKQHNMQTADVKRFIMPPFRDAVPFLFWARMPIANVNDTVITLKDQRFLNSPAEANFTAKAEFYE